jgi:hypothetical protein
LLPRFQAAPVDDWVASSGPWTPGANISLTIEDGSGVVYSDSQTADAGGNFSFDFRGVFDLQRGHVVTVSDGADTKTHTVTNLFLDFVDVAADTVWVHGNGRLSVTADGSGNWTADFGGMTDLTYLSNIGSEQTDSEGDSTVVYWASPSSWAVEIDIKPNSCPNSLNRDPKGVLTVAVHDTPDLDITTIDTASVRLEGVAPIRISVKDIVTPVFVLDPQFVCECNSDGADGYDDLILKFNASDVRDVLGEVQHGDVIELILAGNLIDGTLIEGKDCIVFVKKGLKD